MGGEKVLLSGSAEVAGEEDRNPSPVEAQHQRLLVLSKRRRLVQGDCSIGIEDSEQRRPKPEPLTRHEGAPAGAGTFYGAARVLGSGDPPAIFPELVHAKTREDGAEAARVIGIRMRERHHVEPRRWAVPEKGREHALAYVEPMAACGAAVHE